LTGSDFFYVTLENAALVREIVKVTARITDTLTVVRGQDGTTAVPWDAGTPVALRLNAAALEYAMEASRLSAVGAAASAAAATTQATNAATSAATATTKAGEASTSATNAAASATTATTQASNAATSATNAAASATTATTQAANAATSATNAAESAEAAAESAAAAALFDPSSYYTKPQVDELLVTAVPAGTIIHVAMNTAPSGYIKANGALVSRTTFANLFAAIGTTFGAGDGSTTFALPDLRGEFIRGWADGRAVDTGRVFGTFQADEFKSHTHNLTVFTDNETNGPRPRDTGSGSAAGSPATSATGGAETRPRNVALLACIKV